MRAHIRCFVPLGAGRAASILEEERGSLDTPGGTLQVDLGPAQTATATVTPDASPIVGRTPYDNVVLNCGWGTGGFKATPGLGWCLAHTIAHGEPHPLVAPFGLDRFTTGALVDEHGAAAVAH